MVRKMTQAGCHQPEAEAGKQEDDRAQKRVGKRLQRIFRLGRRWRRNGHRRRWRNGTRWAGAGGQAPGLCGDAGRTVGKHTRAIAALGGRWPARSPPRPPWALQAPRLPLRPPPRPAPQLPAPPQPRRRLRFPPTRRAPGTQSAHRRPPRGSRAKARLRSLRTSRPGQ